MIVVFQHHPIEVPACLGDTLRDAGCRLKVVELYNGQPTPPDLDDVDGVVSMGGPMNVDQTDAYPWLTDEMQFISKAHAAGLPVVGVCLGAQLIAAALGGEVAAMPQAEIGWGEVKLQFPGQTEFLLAGVPWNTTQLHLHGCEITKLPAGGQILASSKACKVQAFRVGNTTFGFQYHFEWDRQTLDTILDDKDVAEFLQKNSVDPAAIKGECDRFYPMYRHLGDRVCRRLAELVFPVDHRLSHKNGVLTSYDPAVS